MHISSFVTLALASAQPVEKRANEFPIPYIGETLTDYSEKLLSFLSGVVIGGVDTLRPITYIAPAPSIDWNCDFHKATAKTNDLPNYDTDFPEVDGVDNDKIKWFIEADNRAKNDPVVYYLHGGGYVFAMFPLFTGLWMDVWKAYNAGKNDKLSIAMLDYPIVPKQGTWPAPLEAAVAAYNKLTELSDNIIIAGDSAGGHLALSLLRHIEHPVEGIDAVTVKPQGLVMLSPWVNVFPNHGEGITNGTYETYENVDLLSANSLSAMGEIAIPDEETRNSPAMNFWKDYINWSDLLPEDKSKVYVSYGDTEVLKGDIQTWIDIAELEDSGATIFRDLAGCEDCTFASGTHDNVVFNFRNSPIFSSLVDFMTANFWVRVRTMLLQIEQSMPLDRYQLLNIHS